MTFRTFRATMLGTAALVMTGCASVPFQHAMQKTTQSELAAFVGKNGVDAPAPNDATPLVGAIWADRADLAKWLLDNGADPNRVDSGGLTPVRIAAYNDRADILELLIKAGAAVDIPKRNGDRAIHAAAQHADATSLDLLIAAGADVNVPGHGQMTPLHHAVTSDANAAIDALLRAGADPDALTGLGNSSLALAASRGNQRAVAAMLDAGADPDAASTPARRALGLAVMRGHVETARLLLEAGADPVGRVNDDTGLSRNVELAFPRGGGAFSDTNAQMIALLGEHGLDFDAKGADGRTAEAQWRAARTGKIKAEAEAQQRRQAEARAQAERQRKKDSWLGRGIALAAGGVALGVAADAGLPLDQAARIGASLAADIASDGEAGALTALNAEMQAEFDAASAATAAARGSGQAGPKPGGTSAGKAMASAPAKPNKVGAFRSQCGGNDQIMAMCMNADALYANYTRFIGEGGDGSQLYEAHSFAAAEAKRYIDSGG